jgi:sugar phosphate isomerase/epimerase
MFGRRAEKDLYGALDSVRDAGYDGVEVMTSLSGSPLRLADACADRDLEIAGFHVFWHELTSGPQLDVAVALGTPRIIVSCIPAGSADEVRGALGPLGEYAKEAAGKGLRLLVHNHAEECHPLAGGSTALEILVENTSAADIGYVVDIHWAAVGGDMLRTIRAVAGRCDYYHVKDGSLADPDNSCPLGAGEVDLDGAWHQARESGPIAVAVVERGGTPPDDLDTALDHDARFVRDLFRRIPGRRAR